MSVYYQKEYLRALPYLKEAGKAHGLTDIWAASSQESIASCYEQLGNKAKARKIYLELSERYPYTELGAAAKKHLKWMDDNDRLERERQAEEKRLKAQTLGAGK